ncbi:PQQ-binding-like beta-propeller repeat protein [Mycolicibacterium canariasense]|jgi:hypothetical protein|uniref:PQQ-binding-like beta-propeller repeat protein n=1 Tax=Mycolicibacterium canariasense TaxID=228230 RepID=UPI000B0EFFA2|nr:PQQ-binding-like beta-propeller repeat protein [Mycolicibacterium canariasense]MCV7211412.1 PQQ-binding-like beta-propeller repeat protein [Mycolicibacterium canariasense]
MSETNLPAPRPLARWTAPVLAIAVGLSAASGVCRLIAQAQKTPSLLLLADRAAVVSVFSRSAAVGAAMLVVLAAYALLAFWRTGDSTRDTAHRRAALLRYLSPTVALLGCIGLWWRVQDSNIQLFGTARDQQSALDGVDVVGLTSIAWVCSCLAVIALAGAAAGADGHRRKRHSPGPGVLIVALTMSAVGGASVLVLKNPTAHHVNAAAAETATVDVGGPVAYEIADNSDPDTFMVAGGPGLIRSTGSGSTPDGVEAISGATGERVWALSYPELWVLRAAVSEPGPGGVVVLQARFDEDPVLIGLDAGTGTPLWTQPEVGALTRDRHMAPLVDAQRFLSVEQVRSSPTSAQPAWKWTVRELQTGQALWSFHLPAGCHKLPGLSASVVIVPHCDGPDTLAEIRSGLTGAVRAVLRTADVGFDVVDTENAHVTGIPGTDVLLVSEVGAISPTSRTSSLIDGATGAVVYRLPDDARVQVPDTRTLVLTGPAGRQTILDLATSTTIETGLATDTLRFTEGLGAVWARVGEQWVTLVPIPGQAPTLKVLSHEEPMKTYPSPCTSADVPRVAAINGALLVNCGDRIVGVR